MGALITAKENFHAVSLSGGKDSTCLLLLMIERGLPIDAVIWADKLKKIRRNFRRISASLWLASTYGKMIVEKDAKEE